MPVKKIDSIFKKSLFAAFFLRLIIAPLGRHSDCDNTFHWAKYLWDTKDFLGFLGKAVPDAMPAMYPPLFYYTIYLWRGFYEFIGKILWWLNLKFSFFPSNFIFWYQSYQGGVAFNKIPAILTDLGCAVLIYKICLLIGCKQKLTLFSSLAYLFLPPYWYNSAHWGQNESMYCLFLLLSLYSLLKNKYLLGLFLLIASLLIKQTPIILFPLFLIYIMKNKKIIDFILAGIFSLIFSYILYFPFQPISSLPWAINFYLNSLKGEISYLVCNGFNFWALLLGFEQRSTSVKFLGLSLGMWGNFMFLALFLLIIFKLVKKGTPLNLINSLFLSSFSAFLFLPKMHERYFYTPAIFLAILGATKKRFLFYFIVLSFIHMINLYHFWWSPKIPFFISLFSNMYIIRFTILINLILFFVFLKNYLRNEVN